MQTEFTCGIYKAKYENSEWAVTEGVLPIATIDAKGKYLSLDYATLMLEEYELIAIAVLMNNIKRQYKQQQSQT